MSHDRGIICSGYVLIEFQSFTRAKQTGFGREMFQYLFIKRTGLEGVQNLPGLGGKKKAAPVWESGFRKPEPNL